MIKIYHNPRCSKSRMGVSYLEEKNLDFEIIKYLQDEFTVESLTAVIHQLNIKPIELIRKNEAIWKSEYKNIDLTDDQLIEAMVKKPKLIERPIVVNNNKAVVARPTEKIEDIL